MKYGFNYDLNNNETHSLEEIWDGNTWVNNEQYTKTYVGNKLESTIQQEWNTTSNSWDNIGKILYTYDNNGNVSIEEYQSWYNGAYFPNYRFVMTYNPDNTLQIKSGQSYVSAVWTEVLKQSFTYDVHGNLLQLLMQDKDSGNSWVNSGKLESTYDGNNLHLTEETAHWNRLAYVWEKL